MPIEMFREPVLPLVSIVIPCFNAERWVSEAVESCLNQTYPNIEIIVVDDGSTDRSLEILHRYLPRIKIETGSNRGGNCARNTGYALSTGDYVQYLDADDYLKPDKISRQVEFLERTRADVVYGDFRSRRHLPDLNYSYLDQIQITGVQQDIVASLLAFWLVNGGAVLCRRSAIDRIGGWDETLGAAQDIDFLMSLALSGATLRYQPGCHFVYRRYGAVTISSSNLGRWLENICNVLVKAEITLDKNGRLTKTYKSALATGYFEVAGACYSFDGLASFSAYAKKLDELIDKILKLSASFRPVDETRTFLALQWFFGLRLSMHFLFRVRSTTNKLRSWLRNTFLFNLVLRARGVTVERECMRRTSRSTQDRVLTL